MYYLEIGLLAVGVILLTVGYWKDRRNVMLVAAIALFLSGALGSFVESFEAGFMEAREASVLSVPALQLNPVFAFASPGKG